MIRLSQNSDAFLSAVDEIGGNDPFACRVRALCRSYAPSLPFVDYWLTADEAGQVNGAIARNGASFLLYMTDRSELREVASFLHMAGAAQVLGNGRFVLEGFAREKTGAVMVTKQPAAVTADCPVIEPDIRAVHALLMTCADRDFCPPAFEDFYVDVSHRLRHGTLRLCGTNANGALASVAMTVAESEDCAVLGAVACHPDHRRRGLGTAAVSALVNRLVSEGKTVYLHRARGVSEAFYRRMGFAPCGTWREYE